MLTTATLALLLSSAGPSEAMELRVLTYNIWGIPVITPSRRARVDGMAAAIAKLDPHMIALQEVWIDDDAAQLARELSGLGFRYSHRFPTESGLLVVSKYPMGNPRFDRYRAGQYPHNPLHVDWMAEKGVGLVTVHTLLGEVDFVCTYL